MPQQREPQQSTSGQTSYNNVADDTIEHEQLTLLTNKRKNKSQLYKQHTPVEPNVIVIDNEIIELQPLCAIKSEEENKQDQQSLLETRKQVAETELCEKQLNDIDQPANDQDTSGSSDKSKLDQTMNAISSQADKKANWCSQNRKKVKKCIKIFFRLFNLLATVCFVVYLGIKLSFGREHPDFNLVGVTLVFNMLWFVWQIFAFCSKNVYKPDGIPCIGFIAALFMQTYFFVIIETISNQPEKHVAQ